MKRFTLEQHISATHKDCRKPCGGRVMWEPDPRYPVHYFGLTGVCLSCGHTEHTQELLAPLDPAELVRGDALPDTDRVLALWKKLMEDKPHAA